MREKNERQNFCSRKRCEGNQERLYFCHKNEEPSGAQIKIV